MLMRPHYILFSGYLKKLIGALYIGNNYTQSNWNLRDHFASRKDPMQLH